MERTWRAKWRQRAYRRLARAARRVHGRGPVLVAVGDSHTDPRTAYTLPHQVWVRIVGRHGYRTLNLGVSGDTTADMRARIEQSLCEGRPEIAVVFGGGNDALRGVDPADTERNVAFMVSWLRDHGVGKVALIGPGLPNWSEHADWAPAAEEVRKVLSTVAERHGALFVDLAAFLRLRIDEGRDPDFRRVPYKQSRSWNIADGDPHFNAYGQRLIADAFLAGTAVWRAPERAGTRRPLLRTARGHRRRWVESEKSSKYRR